jgi:hypothetical protein
MPLFNYRKRHAGKGRKKESEQEREREERHGERERGREREGEGEGEEERKRAIPTREIFFCLSKIYKNTIGSSTRICLFVVLMSPLICNGFGCEPVSLRIYFALLPVQAGRGRSRSAGLV